MHIAAGRSVAKLAELTVVGFFGILLMSGAAVPGSGSRPEGAETPDSVAIDTVDMVLAPVTVLDSVRAESDLPASVVRPSLERYLGRFSDDRLLVRRISRAVLRESRPPRDPCRCEPGGSCAARRAVTEQS